MISSHLGRGLRFAGAAALMTALVLTVSPQRSVRAQDDGTTTYEGNISNQTSEIFYPITLQPGQAVLVTMAAANADDNLDSYLELYDGDQIVAGNDDQNLAIIIDSAMGYISREGGDYRIRATRYPDSQTTGDFVLEVQIGPPELLQRLNELITRVELSGDELLHETEHFLIHYTLRGADRTTESYVSAVAQTAEDVYEIEIEQMGWAKPPEDGAMGGDDRYDIYLSDLIGAGEGAFGITTPEFVVGDNPNSEAIETTAGTSYFRMDNDFDATSGDPISLMRATLGHEYHHSIQFGYDQQETANWFFESTSSWIETSAMGKDEDATGYVEYAYNYPELCLGYVSDDNSQLQYGQWTFMEHLVQLYGPNAVRDLWDAVRTEDSFTALATMLRAHTATVPEVAASYRLRDLARDYDLAPRFQATVWRENVIDSAGRYTYTGQGIQELSANYFAFTATPGIYRAVMLNDRGRLQLWGAGINTDTGMMDAIPLGSDGSFDTTPYDDFYLMVFNPLYDDDVSDCSYYDYDIQVGNTGDKDSLAVPTMQFSARNYEPLHR